MAKLVFKLKGVFDDEADDVRALLDEHKIDFYESPAGNWGISVHGIWLNNDDDFERARELIDQYQQERSQRIREELQQQRDNNQQETILHRLLQRPAELILAVLFILFILYVSIIPFLEMGQP